MANILFQNSSSNSNNDVLGQLNEARSAGPSNVLFKKMYSENPAFRQFADAMRGKTPEQSFRENGLDFNRFRNLRW